MATILILQQRITLPPHVSSPFLLYVNYDHHLSPSTHQVSLAKGPIPDKEQVGCGVGLRHRDVRGANLVGIGVVIAEGLSGLRKDTVTPAWGARPKED